MGLYVIQKGGANLMVISNALSLPLQQLVLCSSVLVGHYQEAFSLWDGVSLILVFAGFLIYQMLSPEGLKARNSSSTRRFGGRSSSRSPPATGHHGISQARRLSTDYAHDRFGGASPLRGAESGGSEPVPPPGTAIPNKPPFSPFSPIAQLRASFGTDPADGH